MAISSLSAGPSLIRERDCVSELGGCSGGTSLMTTLLVSDAESDTPESESGSGVTAESADASDQVSLINAGGGPNDQVSVRSKPG